MNQYSEQANSNTNAFEQAAKLRAEAEAIEAKERMRRRLLELIKISEDPYYDQYLAQMMRDLESGKATPGQIAKEADRTYRLYQQRMGQPATQMQQSIEHPQKQVTRQPINEKKTDSQPLKQRDSVELRIGAGIFSVLGAVFVLAALVIFGFNFLEGICQGLCLYGAAMAVILIAELAVKKLNGKFARVISAIGISSLYIATIINYLVLKNINGLMAAIVTIVIALFAILYSRKKDAAIIRLISVFGSYICFLPIKGFETELSFLIMMGIVFAINIVSILLPNQKDGALIGSVHMVAHTGFTAAVTAMTLIDGMNVMFVSCFVVLSLVLLNLIYYSQRNDLKEWYTVLYAVFLGCFAITLIGVANYDQGISGEKMQMFHKLLTEVMAIAVALVFFILWGKEKCRWMQYYFIVSMVMLLNGITGYDLEKMIVTLFAFVITRLLSREAELLPLDAILTVVTAIWGIVYVEEWYVIPFLVIMALSLFTIRRWHVFHEIVLTVFFFIVPIIYFSSEWMMPVSIGILLVLFMLFNHLPGLNGKEQLPYNITNMVFTGIMLLLYSMLCDDYRINSVSMLVGTVVFLVAFRERYRMAITMKPLFLAIYLCCMICLAGYEAPVVVSVLLMTVALACVGIGLKTKDKVCRICGLVMAIIVSVKMIIYDFEDLDSMAKAILFFVVGIITLVISFVYTYLGKKEDEEVIEDFVQEEAKELHDMNSKERIDAE